MNSIAYTYSGKSNSAVTAHSTLSVLLDELRSEAATGGLDGLHSVGQSSVRMTSRKSNSMIFSHSEEQTVQRSNQYSHGERVMHKLEDHHTPADMY